MFTGKLLIRVYSVDLLCKGSIISWVIYLFLESRLTPNVMVKVKKKGCPRGDILEKSVAELLMLYVQQFTGYLLATYSHYIEQVAAVGWLHIVFIGLCAASVNHAIIYNAYLLTQAIEHFQCTLACYG